MSQLDKVSQKRLKHLKKLEKQFLKEKDKLLKPEECLKYFKAYIDPECLSRPHGARLLTNLGECKINYEIKTQNIPGIITFERTVMQNLIDDNEILQMTDKTEQVEHILFLMQGKELVDLIKVKGLISRMKDVQEIFPNKIVMVLIFGLKEYCRINRHIVGRRQVSMELIDLQMELNCKHQLLDTAEDYGVAAASYSKSIAVIPFKKQKSQAYEEEDIFLLNDNRNCIRLSDEEGTKAMQELWQQQLITLPLVTDAIAQSISNVYPLPKTLVDAYDKTDVGPSLLADISIRRTRGPLTDVSRIGPELSRKIHTLYTSLDPDEIL